MESISGIGYVVWNDAREMFLGRMGSWSPDIRLAQVYAEPRSARMAITRLDEPTLTYPVPVTVSVARNHLTSGKIDEQRRIEKERAKENDQTKPTKPQLAKKPA